MIVGVVIHALGFITASFVTNIVGLYFTQGVMIGVGISFIFIPSVAVLPQWFHKRRTLAQGISSAGSGIGGIIFSSGTHGMINRISLAWSLRITGIICFAVNLSATLLLRDRNTFVKPSQLGFATYLLKRYDIILLLSYSFINMCGYMVLLFSLSNYAVSIGLSQSQASTITALLNAGTAVGRPAIGFASDRLGRIIVAGSLAMFTGLCCFVIWIPATTYGVLIFYALLAGMTLGTFWMVGNLPFICTRMEADDQADNCPTSSRGCWLERGAFFAVPHMACDRFANRICRSRWALPSPTRFQAVSVRPDICWSGILRFVSIPGRALAGEKAYKARGHALARLGYHTQVTCWL